MKKRCSSIPTIGWRVALALLLALSLGILLVWIFLGEREAEASGASSTSSGLSNVAVEEARTQPGAGDVNDNRSTALFPPTGGHPEIHDLTEDISGNFLHHYGAANGSLADDINQCLEMLFAFNRVLQGRSQLPALGNKKLVASLLGNNSDRIRFLSPDSPTINERGELIDRFGTPVFFHFQDGFMPDIRSAGPDQVMWTADDLELGITVKRAF